jgi:hypothetical protein
MIKINFVTSFVYSVGQIGLGLLVHPYQTMQMLVEDKIFAWMSLLPTALLASLTIVWRYGLVPFLSMKLTFIHPFFSQEMLPLFTNWVTFFMLYWQILLLYLLFRFRSVFSE